MGNITPNINNRSRAHLVDVMAKRHSLEAVEAVLERAVKYRESDTIKTATSMLQNILKMSTKNDIYIRLSRKGQQIGDSYHHLRPVSCKPQDCPNCFWRSWCEMHENFNFLTDVAATLKKSRDSLRKPLKRENTRQRWGA